MRHLLEAMSLSALNPVRASLPGAALNKECRQGGSPGPQLALFDFEFYVFYMVLDIEFYMVTDTESYMVLEASIPQRTRCNVFTLPWLRCVYAGGSLATWLENALDVTFPLTVRHHRGDGRGQCMDIMCTWTTSWR